MTDPTLNTLWTNILNAPFKFTELLTETELFDEVLRGYPEDFKNFRGTIATVNFAGLKYPDQLPMSDRNRPQNIKSVLGIISKGTRTDVHDAIINSSILIGSYFENTDEWITLKDTVRNTRIADFIIRPEMVGKQLQTSAIWTLEHDVRFRR